LKRQITHSINWSNAHGYRGTGTGTRSRTRTRRVRIWPYPAGTGRVQIIPYPQASSYQPLRTFRSLFASNIRGNYHNYLCPCDQDCCKCGHLQLEGSE